MTVKVKAVPSHEVPSRAVASLVVLGITYSVLSGLLAREGVVARAVWLPVEPAHYYAWQAVFVGPWFTLLSWLFASVAHRLAGPAPGVHCLATWTALTPRYALPIALLFVVPDAVCFVAGGLDAMRLGMRIYGPIVPIVLVALSASELRRLHGVSRARAVGAVMIALVVQGLVGAILLR